MISKSYRNLILGERIQPGDEAYLWNAECTAKVWTVLQAEDIGANECVTAHTVPIRRRDVAAMVLNDLRRADEEARA